MRYWLLHAIGALTRTHPLWQRIANKRAPDSVSRTCDTANSEAEQLRELGEASLFNESVVFTGVKSHCGLGQRGPIPSSIGHAAEDGVCWLTGFKSFTFGGLNSHNVPCITYLNLGLVSILALHYNHGTNKGGTLFGLEGPMVALIRRHTREHEQRRNATRQRSVGLPRSRL